MTKKEFDKARKVTIERWKKILYDITPRGNCEFCRYHHGDCNRCYIRDTCISMKLQSTLLNNREILAMAVLDWLLWDCTYETIVKSTRRIKPDGE